MRRPSRGATSSSARREVIFRASGHQTQRPDRQAAVFSSNHGRARAECQVAYGEAVQVPGAATRDLLGLGSEKPGELPLEAQPWVLLDDSLADCIGYLVAA